MGLGRWTSIHLSDCLEGHLLVSISISKVVVPDIGSVGRYNLVMYGVHCDRVGYAV